MTKRNKYVNLKKCNLKKKKTSFFYFNQEKKRVKFISVIIEVKFHAVCLSIFYKKYTHKNTIKLIDFNKLTKIMIYICHFYPL